jgi:biopolymer transport protein ExbD
VSALSLQLASPAGARASLREKLEQGVLGPAFAGLGICLIVSMTWLGSVHNSTIYPGCHVSVLLPGSGSGSLFSAEDTVRIALTERLEYVAAGVWIPDVEFDAFAARSLASNPSRTVTLQADGHLPYGAITSAVKRLRGLGARRVYLQTYDSTQPLLKLLSEPWSANPERI